MASLMSGGALQIIGLLLPAILVCALVSIVIVRTRGRRKLPPGPLALPILGHLHLMKENPHQILYKLSQSYGPFMSLRFGCVPVIVASSPHTAQQILQTHDPIFSIRLPTAVDLHLNGYHSMLAAQPGPYLKYVRRLSTTHLLSNKMLKSFTPIWNQEMGDLIQTILAESLNGRPISIRNNLHTTLANVVSRMMFGDKRASQTYVIDLVLQMLHLMASFNLSDFFPWLSWLDLQGYAKQSKALNSKITHVFQKIIDERRQEHQNGSDRPHDFLDTLLNNNNNHSNKMQLTDNDIIAILMNLIVGGIDTSAVAIEWGLVELLTNPNKSVIVKEELHNVVGMLRLVEESDIPKLPYLQAVVKETFRLHPVGPLLIPHYSSQPCHMLGFEIPKNTMAFVNIWAIGRDPSLWENALSFTPERFLGGKVDVRGSHFELVPFGSGRRVCPGLALGLSTVQLVLANLLHCFDWEKMGELDLSEKYDIVLHLANPLIARAIPKIPSELIALQL